MRSRFRQKGELLQCAQNPEDCRSGAEVSSVRGLTPAWQHVLLLLLLLRGGAPLNHILSLLEVQLS